MDILCLVMTQLMLWEQSIILRNFVNRVQLEIKKAVHVILKEITTGLSESTIEVTC